MQKLSVGSVCSGIEAASVAWSNIGFDIKWLSEIADFPTAFLKFRYPAIQNLGDMCSIPQKILSHEVIAPDVICGGTPCQAFSLAGTQSGLNDERGNLTLKFCDIVDKCDTTRGQQGQDATIVLWENVEGVLTDKTNAFGLFLSRLSGAEHELRLRKWPNAGLLRGKSRNIAWRVLDAKYFGIPQQRRRLYVIAGGCDFHPEYILFERHTHDAMELPHFPLRFTKGGHSFEVFREYTDCLYAAYGTKWNGNAAAYNGSLFVAQDGLLRRLSPLECERLMGFPDGYTNVPFAKPTNRYQGVGNSWAVPIVRWIGKRIVNPPAATIKVNDADIRLLPYIHEYKETKLYAFDKGLIPLTDGIMNVSEIPEEIVPASIESIIDCNAPKSIYISPAGCAGILRRKNERRIRINTRLEEVLRNVASQWSDEQILNRSLVQKRGRFASVIAQVF